MPRPPVFGQDLAGLINSNMGPLLGTATLRHYTPGTRGADPTAGVNSTHVDYSCKAIKGKRTFKRGSAANDGQAETLVRSGSPTITLLGGSLPDGINPMPGDLITIDGVQYSIEDVDATPGEAAFTLICSGPP